MAEDRLEVRESEVWLMKKIIWACWRDRVGVCDRNRNHWTERKQLRTNDWEYQTVYGHPSQSTCLIRKATGLGTGLYVRRI